MQRKNRRRRHFRHYLQEFFAIYPHLLCYFFIGGGSAELTLQFSDSALYLLRLSTNGTRNPIQFSEMIIDGSTYPCDRISLKFYILVWIEFFYCIKKPKCSITDKVSIFHHRGQSHRYFSCDILHKGGIAHDDLIADMDIFSPSVKLP